MSFTAGMSILPLFTLPLVQWFLTGEARPPRGGAEEISSGVRTLTCSTTWKVF